MIYIYQNIKSIKNSSSYNFVRVRWWILLFFTAFFLKANAQHKFSGNVDNNRWKNTVYLSLVEDYRKLSGVYYEQIIAKTKTDSSGFFKFTGNFLEDEHRLYRIHVDNCDGDDNDFNHFGGHCPDSKEIVFIAKNTDTINFPFSFEEQMFCDVKSNNEKALALLKIDSLKEDMRFAYTEFRSDANRKLNNKKWFKFFQEYGKNLNEPLAELYIYSFLSDRTSEFHDFYLEDLKTNSYYKDLKNRLANLYPNTNYLKQYSLDLEADLHAVKETSKFPWLTLLAILLTISLIVNGYLFSKIRLKKVLTNSNLKSSLTNQEQTILEHILNNKSNKEIASALFVSTSTVKTHINNIYKKLNVSSREEAKSLF